MDSNWVTEIVKNICFCRDLEDQKSWTVNFDLLRLCQFHSFIVSATYFNFSNCFCWLDLQHMIVLTTNMDLHFERSSKMTHKGKKFIVYKFCSSVKMPWCVHTNIETVICRCNSHNLSFLTHNSGSFRVKVVNYVKFIVWNTLKCI